MIINHNISALYAQRQFSLNSNRMNVSMEKLSSGMRINRGKDDPAGLAVSEKMRAQIRGLRVASRNAQDGVSFLQTAEGWLSETTEILQRMRELAIQTSNGVYTAEDRQQIQVEIGQLRDEIDRIASHAEYNGIALFKGGAGKEGGGTEIALHIGANMDQRVKVSIGNMSATDLKIADVSYSTPDGANKAIGTIDNALNVVNKQRADLGAYQSRLEIASRGIDVAAENLQSAESRIRDTDMALEMVKYVKERILTEASGGLLSQANMRPFIILKLLDGM